MIRYLLTGLLLPGMHAIIFAQADSGLVTWNKYERLKWEDFQASPDKSPADAITNSGLFFDYNYDGDSVLTIKVMSQFQKKFSWVKPESANAKVLRHEQLHFDITELNARLLRKYFSEANYTRQIHFDVMLPRMYNEYIKKLNGMQTIYDVETQHGNNVQVQAQYEINIARQLVELSKFEKTVLVFKLPK